MGWSVQAKIGAGLGMAIALLEVAGLVGYESTRRLIATLGDVAHSHSRQVA